MPVEIIDASRKLVQVKIRGVLTKADHERIIRIAKEAIAREGENQSADYCRSVRRMGAARGLGRCELHDGGRSTDRKNGHCRR